MPKRQPKKPGRPKKPEAEHLDYSFTIRSRRPWRDWLQDAANTSDQSMTDVIDEALVLFARKRKIDPPPKR